MISYLAYEYRLNLDWCKKTYSLRKIEILVPGMNIAIDATSIHSFNQVRGVGRYTNLLIKALQKSDRKNSYQLFTRGQKVPGNIDLVHYPYFDPFFLTMPWWPAKPVIVTVHDLIPVAFMEKFRPGRRGKLKWTIQRLLLQRASRIITDSQASADDLTRYCTISSEKMTVVPLAATPGFAPVTSQTPQSNSTFRVNSLARSSSLKASGMSNVNVLP